MSALAQLFAQLVTALVEEQNLVARGRLCDEWSVRYRRELAKQGVPEDQAEQSCIQVLIGAIYAADTVLEERARRAQTDFSPPAEGSPPRVLH